MEKLTSDQIKKVELGILLELQRVCNEHHLRLYLCGGTLLGAVRHKGFIPWDDDIDVCLPRPDYEKLIRLSRQGVFQKNFTVHCGENHNFQFPFLKVMDNRTRLNQEYMLDQEEDGLWVDVLPVDGLPEDENELERIYHSVGKNRRLLSICYAKKGKGKTWVNRVGKRLISLYANPSRAEHFRTRILQEAKKYPYEQSAYVGILTWGLYGERERMEKAKFETASEVTFEGYPFQAMSCWNEYLTNLYGDYMKLPPENKRKTHDMDAWIRDGYTFREVVGTSLPEKESV